MLKHRIWGSCMWKHYVQTETPHREQCYNMGYYKVVWGMGSVVAQQVGVPITNPDDLSSIPWTSA